MLLGALGAHALKERLFGADLAIFETAVRYQFYHALAMLARLFGIGVFSGSLYLLVATGVRKFGMTTPLGGTALIVGWLLLASAAWRVDGGVNELTIWSRLRQQLFPTGSRC